MISRRPSEGDEGLNTRDLQTYVEEDDNDADKNSTLIYNYYFGN